MVLSAPMKKATISLPDPSLNCLPEKSVKKIHLMGIGGTGMSALAAMLVDRGFAVSGSDGPIYPPVSDFLHSLPIRVFTGYRPENLDPAPDLVVVGNVIRRDNPEACAMARLGLLYLSMPQTLALLFLRQRTPLVVAGTHGKTTTSSMLASVLAAAGADPGFFIGGIVQAYRTSAREGTGRFFVVEGDEYDTAFFNKVPKFLHYQPTHAILTSVEFDHADIYNDFDAVRHAFCRFAAILPRNGSLIVCMEDPEAARVAERCPAPVIGYGLAKGDWRAVDLVFEGHNSSFTVLNHKKETGRFDLPMPGRHNVLNALAVITLLSREGIDQHAIQQGLKHFGGVRRRQEIRGEVDGITVIDDFAHHPTAVRETLAALKNAYPGRRLVAVFEPRTNTSRRAVFQDAYAGAFDNADRVCLKTPLPLDHPVADDLFSIQTLTRDLEARHVPARWFSETTELLNHLAAASRPGDLIAILSNGGFDNIHQRLLDLLQSNRTALA